MQLFHGVGMMVDLETMSTAPNALVTSIGIAVFDEAEVLESYHLSIIAEGQKGHISEDTVRWWLDQDPAVFAQSRTSPLLAVDVARRVREVWMNSNANTIWAKPAHFDLPILENFIRSVDVRVPWSHRDIRCLRTVEQIVGRKVEVMVGAHNAEIDARAQAEGLVVWNKDLNK